MRAPKTAFRFALLAACALSAFGLNARTPTATAEDKRPSAPVDPARQAAKLEEQIAELRKQRKSMAWDAIRAAERLNILRWSPGCGAVREVQDEVDTLYELHRLVETITDVIRADEDTFAKLYGVPPTGYLELIVRNSPDRVVVLKMRDAAGTKLGTTTVSGWSEPMLTRVLLLMQAAPGMPKELRLVAQPTIIDKGVIPVLKACAAAGYKTVVFTGWVTTDDDSVKPGENPETAGFKWYDEEARNPAELAKEIETAPKRF